MINVIARNYFSQFLKAYALIIMMLVSGFAVADNVELTGAYVAEKMFKRPEGKAVSRVLDMVLTDKKGGTRKRTAIVLRRKLADQKQTVIRFSKPRSVKGMAFLTHDRIDHKAADEQWLYMPAMKKVRRIPSSKRGDYFLGTDFTYNDVKDELKLDPADYVFSYEEKFEKDGKQYHRISAKPSSAKIGSQLGYGALTAVIADESWMPIEILFLDRELKPLKQIYVRDIQKISGIWAPMEIDVTNKQTNHMTKFTYKDVVYSDSLKDKFFSMRELKSGNVK